MRILKFVQKDFCRREIFEKVLNIMQPYFIGSVLKCIVNV